MMAQNLTKFTLTMVVLGITLAMAVFRPSILPPNLLEGNSPKPTQQENPSTMDLCLAKVGKREALLDEREAALDEREAALNEREAALNEREESLEANEARLRAKEASLVDWEQDLRGLKRCFVAALIGGGLLAGLLVLILVTQTRQDQHVHGKAHGGKVGQGIRVTQTQRSAHSRYSGAAATAVPAYRGNGRNGERVKL